MLLNHRILLFEVSSASDQAHQLGLKSAGGAYWMDDNGRIVAKTVKDTLVKFVKTKSETPVQQKDQGDVETSTASNATVVNPTTPPSPKLTADVILGKKISGPGGGNEGGVYEGTDGVQRYVKFYKNENRSYTEHLANQIYKELDINAPTTHVFKYGDATFYASDIIPGKTLGASGKLTIDVANDILDGFAADVLVANWDAVGLGNDNILLTPEGAPVRIDNGASFMFRAVGDNLKYPSASQEKMYYQISEWNYLANPSVNSMYANIFAVAGYKNGDDLGKRAVAQIKDIAALRQKYGNWSNFVEQKVPDMNPKTKDQVIEMLETRFKLLVQKAIELKNAQGV